MQLKPRTVHVPSFPQAAATRPARNDVRMSGKLLRQRGDG
jgi:hypothetical protein